MSAPRRAGARLIPCTEALAERAGEEEGRNNIHTSRHNFRIGKNWIAWLNGWRRGQVLFKEKRAVEEQHFYSDWANQ